MGGTQPRLPASLRGPALGGGEQPWSSRLSQEATTDEAVCLHRVEGKVGGFQSFLYMVVITTDLIMQGEMLEAYTYLCCESFASSLCSLLALLHPSLHRYTLFLSMALLSLSMFGMVGYKQFRHYTLSPFPLFSSTTISLFPLPESSSWCLFPSLSCDMATSCCTRPEVVYGEGDYIIIFHIRALERGRGASENFPRITVLKGAHPRQPGMEAVSASIHLTSPSNPPSVPVP